MLGVDDQHLQAREHETVQEVVVSGPGIDQCCDAADELGRSERTVSGVGCSVRRADHDAT